MITTIIPTYRNPKYLDLCLKSATENKSREDTEILVVVDGYYDESESVIQKYDDVIYIDLESNRGMQYALNVGVMQANNPFVFIVNDDNVFCRNWDARLASEIHNCEVQYGPQIVLTVDQVEPTGPGMFHFVVNDLGQTVDQFQYEEWLQYEFNSQNVDIAEDGHIFPFVVQKKWYMAVGGFDTFYDSPNICDWDHFLKYELLNFKFPRTRALRLYHFGSVSTKKNTESSNFKNRERAAAEAFQWKWGVPPFNGVNNTKIYSNQFRGFYHA